MPPDTAIMVASNATPPLPLSSVKLVVWQIHASKAKIAALPITYSVPVMP
jgi:hypothetical protein